MHWRRALNRGGCRRAIVERIIGAGLRGAGYDIDDAAVGAVTTDGGAAGFIDIVARLLRATFGADEHEGRRASAEEIAGPFPGTT